jgi:hypothetical protein
LPHYTADDERVVTAHVSGSSPDGRPSYCILRPCMAPRLHLPADKYHCIRVSPPLLPCLAALVNTRKVDVIGCHTDVYRPYGDERRVCSRPRFQGEAFYGGPSEELLRAARASACPYTSSYCTCV